MAISIPISLVCAIALPVLLVVSVIALTVFLFCLKNAYTKINKHSLEKDSLELKNNKLKSKREELRNKFPCITDFLCLNNIFNTEYSKELFQFKNEDDIDNAKDLIFKPFLSGLYGKDYDFEKDKPNIEKKKQDNYISYKYTINEAKNIENNGLCIEVKICYDRELNSGNETPMMDSMDVSLSKEHKIIAKITKNI